jgi:hypothetical protein
VNFIDAWKDWLFLSFGAFFAREGEIYFKPILKSKQDNLAARRRTMAAEAMLAGRHDRRLQVENGFILQTRIVRKIAGSTASSGSQTYVGVHLQVNSLGVGWHGYWLLAKATSQASRQSGQ